MKFLTTIPVLATLVAVGAGSALVKRDYYTCQTSDGSPYTSDCQEAINQMNNDSQCVELNDQGSGCSNIYQVGTCIIVVCTQDNTQGPNYEIGNTVSQLQFLLNECAGGNGRVGGYYHYDRINSGSCGDNGYNGYANVEFVHS